MPASLLHFQTLADGCTLAVDGEHVLQYLDTTPPSFVPQPGARRGVVGVAALSWSGVDHAPVAIIDVPFTLDLAARPQPVGPLLLVRGSDGTVAGLLTAETARPPRYETLADLRPLSEWEPHPKLGQLLRSCPQPDPADGPCAWLLDVELFLSRLSQLEG